MSVAPSISADGRRVAFTSGATNLVTGDSNGQLDVFVLDRAQASTVRVSVSSTGFQVSGFSSGASISADGQHVTFASAAGGLVSNDIGGFTDVFVYGITNGLTRRISLNADNTPGNQNSDDPVISGDGRFVAFASVATNLVDGDTNSQQDVFVRDRGPGCECSTPTVVLPPPGGPDT